MSRYDDLANIEDDIDPLHPEGWDVADLLPAWNGERLAVEAHILTRIDGTRLFTPGINYLFGDSGDGKSWVALIAAVQELRAGHDVAWVTYEDPNELELVARLKLLGCTDDDRKRLHVIIATETLSTGTGYLARLIRQTRATLIVLDSIGEALAVAGVNEDKDAEFGPWARQTLRHLLDLCADPDWENADGTEPNPAIAVLPIDHSTKAKDNPHYPSGTKRKRAMVTGLMASLNVRQPFARDRRGSVQLVCSKDRSGRFRRGEIVAEVTIDATGDHDVYATYIDGPAPGAEMANTKKRTAVDRVLAVLTESSVPLDSAEVHRLVNADDARLPGEGEFTLGSVRNALAKLAERPNVTREDEPTGTGKSFRRRYGIAGHKSDGGTPDD